MCGIVAIYSYSSDAPPVDLNELKGVRDYMIPRGPDGKGEWQTSDGRVAFGHRRLAILDLSEKAAQPMMSTDGKYVITYNGEIYNYQSLRQQLEQKGYHFRSQSDTEVLLYLYAERGEAMVHDLRGMYAFAIWDEHRKGMFMARDPFGIKPLYYADDGNTFKVASQVKALLAGGNIDKQLDPAGQVGFFLWGSMPEPYTLYKSIRALPAGTSLWIDQKGSKSLTQFLDIGGELRQIKLSNQDNKKGRDSLREVLLDSVKHHLIADVPVGFFLSSGLDSTTLTALASELSNQLQTVTLGFKEYQGNENDEVPLAENVAHLYGTRHQTVWVKKEDFAEDIDRLLKAMDQPTIDGVNSYFVCKAAASIGLKVAVSGLGGDELFGGYPSFQQIPQLVNSLKPFNVIPMIGKSFRFVSAPIIKNMSSPKYASLIEYGGSYEGAYLLRRGMYMPWELPELLGEETAKEGLAELDTISRLKGTIQGIEKEHLKVSVLEMSWYMRNQLLRDIDWASMAHSLEVRVPLVDIELFRKVLNAIGSNLPLTKKDMALTPKKPLPPQILNREKTGFSIPVQDWLLCSHGNESEKLERGLRGWAKHVYHTAVTNH